VTGFSVQAARARARELGLSIFVLSLGFRVTAVAAATLEIRIENPPATGDVIALLFDSPNAFVDLRDPSRTVVLPDKGKTPARINDLPAGEYALVVFHDANGNGLMDKNFIGIPREWLGFSNRYWPEGPPTFARAAFALAADETKNIDVTLRSIFGKLGLLGVGLGVITQSSPYRGSDRLIVQPIPAISYIGDRVQILGPGLQCGLYKWRNIVGLAVTGNYRLGAYDEEDSPVLAGMGDRQDTFTGGLALQAFLPGGVDVSAGYEQDLLNRYNGGEARLGVEKSFQRGLFTLTPQVGLNSMSAELAHYEFGVPSDKVQDGRPTYQPGYAVSVEYGLGLFIELRGAWRVILRGNTAHLPANLTESPIVDQSQVFTGFAAVNRLF
jgi:outer membrane protein